MNASEKVDQIIPALIAAQAELAIVAKSGKNAEFNYTFADVADYVSTVKPILAKHDLALVASVADTIVLESRSLGQDRRGNERFMQAIRVKLVSRIWHKSGQWVESVVYGEGQDTQDKAVYKAITGARKYGYAAALGLATADDPERDPSPPSSQHGQQGDYAGNNGRRQRGAGGGGGAGQHAQQTHAPQTEDYKVLATQEEVQAFSRDFKVAMLSRGADEGEVPGVLRALTTHWKRSIDSRTPEELAEIVQRARTGKYDDVLNGLRRQEIQRQQELSALEDNPLNRALNGQAPQGTHAGNGRSMNGASSRGGTAVLDPEAAERAAAEAHRKLELRAEAFARDTTANGKAVTWLLSKKKLYLKLINEAMATVGLESLDGAPANDLQQVVMVVAVELLQRGKALE